MTLDVYTQVLQRKDRDLSARRLTASWPTRFRQAAV